MSEYIRVRVTVMEEDGLPIVLTSSSVPANMPESKIITYARGMMFEAGYVQSVSYTVCTTDHLFGEWTNIYKSTENILTA